MAQTPIRPRLMPDYWNRHCPAGGCEQDRWQTEPAEQVQLCEPPPPKQVPLQRVPELVSKLVTVLVAPLGLRCFDLASAEVPISITQAMAAAVIAAILRIFMAFSKLLERIHAV